MKKLNNRGWSLGLMVILLCVLCFFILVIAILSFRFKTNVIDASKENEKTQMTLDD